MNGVLLIDKPEGITSYDCIRRLKKVLGKKEKIGHLGTLDPMATGLLPILIGKATRLFNILTTDKKTYLGEMQLGIKTDTGDITGNIIEKDSVKMFDEDIIYGAFDYFNGGYQQKPPMYSAKRINGKRLYELARKNITVEREASYVELYDYKIISYNKEEGKIVFIVDVGKGFYVRSFVEDLASVLGTVATLSSLRRTAVGHFLLDKAVNVDTLETREDVEKYLISLGDATIDLETIKVNDDIAKKTLNGIKPKLDVFKEISGYVKIIDKNDNLIAVGEVINSEFKFLVVIGE